MIYTWIQRHTTSYYFYDRNYKLRRVKTCIIYIYFHFGLATFYQRLYNNGAKKFEIAGVGAIGCCPAYRVKNKTECVSEANDLSVKYNEALQSMLKEWQLENKDISYSYFDTYAAIQDLVQNPASYGIY